MEYHIIFAIMITAIITAIIILARTLSKALSNKKNGAFRIEIRLGKLVFVLDFSSSKT